MVVNICSGRHTDTHGHTTDITLHTHQLLPASLITIYHALTVTARAVFSNTCNLMQRKSTAYGTTTQCTAVCHYEHWVAAIP